MSSSTHVGRSSLLINDTTLKPKLLSSKNTDDTKAKRKNPFLHLVAGGTAGLVESSICHPLDTIKTRMQLRRTQSAVEAARKLSSISEPNTIAVNKSSFAERPPVPLQQKPGTISATLGPFGTASRIIKREGFGSLYKGLTAVYTGIIPKMALRFVSFEAYRDYLGSSTWFPGPVTFTAGLLCGLTEAIMVVTPADVCKIRMQSQYHSMMDPSQMALRKYRNVVQTAVLISKEEGMSALYKGVVPTMIRQGVNQSVNFTCYNSAKSYWVNRNGGRELESWKTMLIGGISGGFGPLLNNPLDVVKTRMQKQVITVDQPAKYTGLLQSCLLISKEEGWQALWKGITPRLMRIMPGQAITFMVYEKVSSTFVKFGILS